MNQETASTVKLEKYDRPKRPTHWTAKKKRKPLNTSKNVEATLPPWTPGAAGCSPRRCRPSHRKKVPQWEKTGHRESGALAGRQKKYSYDAKRRPGFRRMTGDQLRQPEEGAEGDVTEKKSGKKQKDYTEAESTSALIQMRRRNRGDKSVGPPGQRKWQGNPGMADYPTQEKKTP